MKRPIVISIATVVIVAAGAVASCTVDNPKHHRGCPDGMIADGMDCIRDPDAQGGQGGSGNSRQGGDAGTLNGGAAGGGSAGKGDGDAGGAGFDGRGGDSSGGNGGSAAQAGNANGGGGGLTGTAGAAGSGPLGDGEFCIGELNRAAQEYNQFRNTYADPSSIPRSYQSGQASVVSTGDWTSGFPAGSYWYLYEHTGAEDWLTAAQARTQALYGQRLRTSDHNVGFIIYSSYGNGHRLTGSSVYGTVLSEAAASTVQRFDSVVGAIRSWDSVGWHFPVVIDHLMNLELLFRATELGAGEEYKEVATTHLLTTAANHLREDGSHYQVVDFDEHGSVIAKRTSQGISDDSTWARGQAWGLYGFTMAYRETKDVRYLTRATAMADFYVEHENMPEDGVPYFDFSAPDRDDVPNYRDASAGAIATSALFELSTYVSGTKGQAYRDFAVKAVRTLSSSDFRAEPGTNGHFLLMHAMGNYPLNQEVDAAINYADYYYLEALMRCKSLD